MAKINEKGTGAFRTILSFIKKGAGFLDAEVLPRAEALDQTAVRPSVPAGQPGQLVVLARLQSLNGNESETGQGHLDG